MHFTISKLVFTFEESPNNWPAPKIREKLRPLVDERSFQSNSTISTIVPDKEIYFYEIIFSIILSRQ